MSTMKSRFMSSLSVLCALMILIGIMPTGVFADSTEKYKDGWIYFDISSIVNSNIPDSNKNEWRNGPIYIFAWGNFDRTMSKITDTVYGIDVSTWGNTNNSGNLIFTTKNNWDEIKKENYRRTAQVNYTIESAKGKIFSWDNNTDSIDGKVTFNLAVEKATIGSEISGSGSGGGGGSGEKRRIYFDATLSKIDYIYDENSIYFDISNIPNDKNRGAWNSKVYLYNKESNNAEHWDEMNKVSDTLYELNPFKWENINTRGSLIFAVKNNWNDVNNGGNYVRTQQVNSTLESAKGKVFRWNGNDDYIDGKPQLGIASVSQSNFSSMGNGNGIKCYANNQYYDMVKLSTYSSGANTWSDVYYVDLPNNISKVRFLRKDVNVNDLAYGRGTIESDIPSNLTNPCFYADSGDDLDTWKGKERKGYWDEVYTIRNSEQSKNNDIVDISKNSTFEIEKDNNAFYLDSTFYDYYSDYEINGNNRDRYNVNNGGSQRNWVTFRQFDQALSDVYSKDNVTYPIYTGHFQPDGVRKSGNPDWEDWGCRFRWVANSLNLYGWNNGSNYNEFFSINNSTIDRGNNSPRYEYAVQGLVSNTLNNGTLKMSNNTTNLPHFDKEFLNGKNSKNTQIGEVYEDVKFPFTKKDVFNEGIDYYCFDSAITSLAIHQDRNTNEYYLKNVGNANKYKNVDSASNSSGEASGGDKLSNIYGFFPFNETSTDTHANTYNYGFGTKIEFKFRLTDDGKVEGKPMKFLFSGDDDVWVYIDGNLALDVGGDHGMTSGVLDFSTKKAYVSDVKAGATNGTTYSNSQDKYNLTYNGTNIKFGQEKDFTLQQSRANGNNEHTLTFYYMERGMWESNMKIAFNFAPIPDDESQLNVTKTVDTSNVNNLFSDFVTSLNNKSFDFSISNLATHYGTGSNKSKSGSNIEDYGSAVSGKLEPAKGAAYTSSNGTNGNVDNNGNFKVKDKETITFNEQFRTDSYVSINENLSDNDKKLFSTQWQINGSNTANSGTALDDGRTYTITQEDEDSGKQKNNNYKGTKPNTNTLLLNGTTPTKVSATCVNTINTGSISLKKTSVGEKLKGKEFTFNIKFSNIGGTNLEKEETVKLKSDDTTENGTYTIEGIPVGTKYTITESSSAGSVLNKVTRNGTEIGTSNVSGEISSSNDSYNYIFENKVTEYGISIQKFGVSPDTPNVNWDTAVKLSGATFQITSNGTVLRFVDNGNSSYEYSTSGQRVPTVTTGENGILNITKLPVGTYKLQEINAPDGYLKNNTQYNFTISDDGEVSITSPYNDKMVTVDGNTIKVANKESKISIQKFGISSDAESVDWNKADKIAGAEFTIKNSTSNATVKFINNNGNYEYSTSGVETIKTGENGILNITKLPVGTYKLQETKAPDGYLKNENEYTFIVSDNGTVSITDDEMADVDGNTIKVANRAKPLIILPGTGGSGASSKLFNFALFGVVAIGLSGGVWLLVNKKFKLRKGEGIK